MAKTPAPEPKEKMTRISKDELVKSIAEKTGFRLEMVRTVIDSMVQDVTKAVLDDGCEVWFKPFFKFMPRTQKARKRYCRHGKEGTVRNFPAKRQVVVKPFQGGRKNFEGGDPAGQADQPVRQTAA